jgi:citrate lyase subunit beta/citryl-CoA lyase
MRSKLFVPGSRPELFLKALAGNADALSFDLEDAVVESRKAEARENLHLFLQSPDAMNSKKTFIVRINAMDTPHFKADLQAVLTQRIDLINLPKPSSVADVLHTIKVMESVEAENRISRPIRLLLNIETSAALRNAHELASAHPRVAGLQLGFADLFEPLAIARSNTAAVEATMFMARMAAGEAGLFVCDSAFANIKDMEGFRAEAKRARDFGFIGKSCIHPSQIETANEIFRPSDEEIAQASRILASIGDAAANGAGAYVVDGKMIDKPFIMRAQTIIAQAKRLALLPGQISGSGQNTGKQS